MLSTSVLGHTVHIHYCSPARSKARSLERGTIGHLPDNASFCILPDGTTLLIEAGAINEEYVRAIPPTPKLKSIEGIFW
jgi:hypothetical protein